MSNRTPSDQYPVTACIVSFNEEANIRRCLESVAWCQEIVVVDSFSTDRTVEIAREYTENVIQREWPGFRAQKEYARQQGTCEWSLMLDCDEEISRELQTEIFQALETADGIDGFEMPRMVYYLGRWIKHGDWYPDRKLRLYRKNRGEIVGIDPHDYVDVQGETNRLSQPINHYTYDDLAHHMNTINRFSTISAEEKFKRGKRAGTADLLFRPLWKFIRGYFVKRGFLDGRQGLIIAQLTSFEVWLKYLKLKQLSSHAAEPKSNER
jgi:glycosyltransferase involved in cell wall biosynthesis